MNEFYYIMNPFLYLSFEGAENEIKEVYQNC